MFAWVSFARASPRLAGQFSASVNSHAIDSAWDAGCYKVVLTTSRKDPAVWAFYERCGFDSSDKRAFVIRR